MHRLASYIIAVLLAVILTILPSAMWPDMALPMDNWENWYWKGQPHPRPKFSLQDPPQLFMAEVRMYKILVAPGAYASRAFTGSPTSYASFFIPPYRETGAFPPLAMALEHARWAFPVWLASLIVVFELSRLVRRRARQAGTSTVGQALVAGCTIFLLGCGAAAPPRRPSGVPANAVWAGGAAGGAWIDCEFAWKEPYVTYTCGTFKDRGQQWARGAYVLATVTRNVGREREFTPADVFARVSAGEYVAFDGVAIHLKANRVLVPHGEVDFPFGDAMGKDRDIISAKRLRARFSTDQNGTTPEQLPNCCQKLSAGRSPLSGLTPLFPPETHDVTPLADRARRLNR